MYSLPTTSAHAPWNPLSIWQRLGGGSEAMTGVGAPPWNPAQAQEQLAAYIVDNPTTSLATAFFFGVAIAWLIKRR